MKFRVIAVVGVPLITPVLLFRLRPVGKVPDMDHFELVKELVQLYPHYNKMEKDCGFFKETTRHG